MTEDWKAGYRAALADAGALRFAIPQARPGVANRGAAKPLPSTGPSMERPRYDRVD
jgi:hypothetical protein